LLKQDTHLIHSLDGHIVVSVNSNAQIRTLSINSLLLLLPLVILIGEKLHQIMLVIIIPNHHHQLVSLVVEMIIIRVTMVNSSLVGTINFFLIMPIMYYLLQNLFSEVLPLLVK